MSATTYLKCAILALSGVAVSNGTPVFNGSLGVGSSPFTFSPGQVQIGATGVNAANFHDFTDYQPVALEWALSMSSSVGGVTPDIFPLVGGTSGTITMPSGETITFGLSSGTGTSTSNFSPIGGDSINGTVVLTTYQPDGSGGTILNGVVSVTGTFLPNSFFSSLGLRSGFPGGQLAISLDVTCSPGPCIAPVDPGGTVTSTNLAPDSSVPEPSTLGIAGFGLGIVALLRRRRRC
jgi:hypothetical protein